VYGNHLISDTTATWGATVHLRLLADFRDLPAATFSVCLLMLQKWAVR
jgi:hypothetical protein